MARAGRGRPDPDLQYESPRLDFFRELLDAAQRPLLFPVFHFGHVLARCRPLAQPVRHFHSDYALVSAGEEAVGLLVTGGFHLGLVSPCYSRACA